MRSVWVRGSNTEALVLLLLMMMMIYRLTLVATRSCTPTRIVGRTLNTIIRPARIMFFISRRRRRLPLKTMAPPQICQHPPPPLPLRLIHNTPRFRIHIRIKRSRSLTWSRSSCSAMPIVAANSTMGRGGTTILQLVCGTFLVDSTFCVCPEASILDAGPDLFVPLG